MEHLEKELELALKEIERLNQENHQLKQQLQLAGITSNDPETKGFSRSSISNEAVAIKGNIHNYSTPSEKISLFRELFRGREDVYPNRWESKTGKSGYSPACGNEWSMVCKKPQIKCSDCSPIEHFFP
jgi:hypothetical protein